MAERIDFNMLSSFLLLRINEILPVWLPGGHMEGAEYCCGDLRGGQGKSCKINLHTAKWADFSSNERGGDLISLYAAINNIKNQGAAARDLATAFNYQTDSPVRSRKPKSVTIAGTHGDEAVDDFTCESTPTMKHLKYGLPVDSWVYLSATRQILFYMARYDTPGGKQFIPWSWNGKHWVPKATAKPRPLFGLDQLAQSKPDAPILIVEGEKSVLAARNLTKLYVVMSWPNGARAVSAADWSPIYGRQVLIWPDADVPGTQAAALIATILTPHCPNVKTITVDMNNGWDAADAVAQGWTTKRFFEWARERAHVFNVAVSVSNTVNNVEIMVNDPDQPAPLESNYGLWERLGLALNANGYPICNEDNVVRIFRGEPKLTRMCFFDEFYWAVMVEDNGEIRPWFELDTYSLMINLQANYGLTRIGEQTVWRAVTYIANQTRRNEPRDWFNGLTWDGTPRIDRFFCDYLGAGCNQYTQTASKNFFISMVARVYNPGCIMRTMVILKSEQLMGKSPAFSGLGGKWSFEVLENIQSKDFLQSLHGNLIVEFGDLSGMDRADINRVKQIISCRKDRFRAPYDRIPRDHLRRCVLVGSTNEESFLRDDTGGTRFWPIEVHVIDQPAIIRDREQLFAEAVSRFKAGENWHIMPKNETAEAQENYRQIDEWQEVIEHYYSSQPSVLNQQISVTSLAKDCLKIPIDKLDKSTQMRIARNLKILGWKKKLIRNGEIVKRIWEKEQVTNFEVDTW